MFALELGLAVGCTGLGTVAGWYLHGARNSSKQVRQHVAQAMTDSLTGLANRRALDAELLHRFSAWRRRHRPFSLLLIDLDHFKKLNDQYGHLAGDDVLRMVARVLSAAVRPQDLVARYGGEELVVVLPGTKLGQATVVAERIRSRVQKAVIQAEGTRRSVTASIGIAEVRAGDTEPNLIGRADEALYAAKRAGRNCCVAHDGIQCRPSSEIKITLTAAGSDRRGGKSPAGRRTTGSTARRSISDREAFVHALRRRLAEAQRYDTSFSVMLVRTQGKPNDKDTKSLMAAIGELLPPAVRTMDMVARFDKRTYGVMLPCANLREAMGVADRAFDALVDLFEPGQARQVLEIGCVQPSPVDSLASLLARAEASLRQHPEDEIEQTASAAPTSS